MERIGYGYIRYSGIPATSYFAGCIVSEPTLLFVITLLRRLRCLERKNGPGPYFCILGDGPYPVSFPGLLSSGSGSVKSKFQN